MATQRSCYNKLSNARKRWLIREGGVQIHAINDRIITTAAAQRETKGADNPVSAYLSHGRRTMELSHDGTEAVNHKNSKAKPKRLPGVGSSDLVRQSTVHHSKISGRSLAAKTH